MSIEAMKQALEALEECRRDPRLKYEHLVYDKTITALRTAIEAAEKQEPVAWQGVHDQTDLYYRKPPQADVRPLYTTPPAAQRLPLTDEKIWLEYQRFWPFHPAEEPRLAKDIVKFARAVEAAHGIKEKNT